MDCKLVIPRYNMVMGAFGAALLAKRAAPLVSRFRGYEVADRVIGTRGFTCEDCSNGCEILEILEDNQVIGRSGGRCGKWENR